MLEETLNKEINHVEATIKVGILRKMIAQHNVMRIALEKIVKNHVPGNSGIIAKIALDKIFEIEQADFNEYQTIHNGV